MWCSSKNLEIGTGIHLFKYDKFSIATKISLTTRPLLTLISSQQPWSAVARTVRDLGPS